MKLALHCFNMKQITVNPLLRILQVIVNEYKITFYFILIHSVAFKITLFHFI